MWGDKDASDPDPMIGRPTGHAIRRRRLSLGIKSVREFAERSGVSREAVTAAEHGTASVGTYGRLEAWLDRAELDEAPGRRDDGQVEFRLSGSLGVEVVVRGPVAELAELESAVTRLLREMRLRTSRDGM